MNDQTNTDLQPRVCFGHKQIGKWHVRLFDRGLRYRGVVCQA